MIEIKCTESEKDIFMEIMRGCSEDDCGALFGKDCYDINDEKCTECINNNIKFEIVKEELKPCPFCGSVAEAKTEKRALWCEYLVVCRDCHVQTEKCTTKDEAIKVWNRREEEQEEF